MEVVIVYCAVVYAYALGICIEAFSDAVKDKVLTGMFLTLIFAPLLIPLIHGMIFCKKNYES